MATASGAPRCVRGREGGRTEEEEGVQRERDDRGGSRPSSWRREGVGEAATAKQEVAGVGARASSTQLLRALAREEDRRRGGQVGWAAQVGCTVLGCGWLLGKVQVISVLYFSVLFCFYLILLPLFSNLNKFKTVPNIL